MLEAGRKLREELIRCGLAKRTCSRQRMRVSIGGAVCAVEFNFGEEKVGVRLEVPVGRFQGDWRQVEGGRCRMDFQKRVEGE